MGESTFMDAEPAPIGRITDREAVLILARCLGEVQELLADREENGSLHGERVAQLNALANYGLGVFDGYETRRPKVIQAGHSRPST